MTGIPPVLPADAEDVAWALQTAEALWKRSERVDAIVWLRRAAQAAGETEDDDRALDLARSAAELTDWLAHNPNVRADGSGTPKPSSNAPTAGAAVDDLLRVSLADEYEVRASQLPQEFREASTEPPTPPFGAGAEPVSASDLLPAPSETPPELEPQSAEDEGPHRTTPVPSAAVTHAGILDPWAEGEPVTQERDPGTGARPAPTAPAVTAPAPAIAPALPSAFAAEEVVTSAPPAVRPSPAKPPPPAPPRRIPPAPPSRPALEPSVAPTLGLDLTRAEALSDLPDDAREAFAGAAVVQHLAKDEEVAGFALALVLAGQLDLSATIADAVAMRLQAGQVLRARGTIEHVTPVRLVCASGAARVATWDEAAVEAAFRTCPWVEDDLRAAGDRYQVEVGITLGPMGDRLDQSLRHDLTRRLTLRSLAEHEVYAVRGRPLPGLLVVGAGELELLDEQDQAVGETLRAGDFVFPGESLRAAVAPFTVRAAMGGALVLFAERGVAQELLVTCPPLMEIFADS